MTEADLLRSYLLGSLADAEAQDLETRLLVDDSLNERLELEQDALVEAHVGGRLPAPDSERLAARAQTNPELAEHIRQARLLYRHHAAAGARDRPWWPLAAAAALLVAGGAWWWQHDGRKAPVTARGPSPGPSMPPPSAQPPRRDPVVASLTLSPGQTMGADDAERVVLDETVQQLRLELLLDGAPARAYAASLWNSRGERVWGAEAPPGPAAPVVVVTVPARVLPPGRWRLELAPARASSGDAVDYFFEVRTAQIKRSR